MRNALDVIAATGRETVDEMRTLARRAPIRRRPGALSSRSRAWPISSSSSRGPRGGTAGHAQDRGRRRDRCRRRRPVRVQDRPGGLTNTLKHAGPAPAPRFTVRYQDGRSPSRSRTPAARRRCTLARAPATGCSAFASGWRCCGGGLDAARAEAAASPSGRGCPWPPRRRHHPRPDRRRPAAGTGGFRLILEARARHRGRRRGRRWRRGGRDDCTTCILTSSSWTSECRRSTESRRPGGFCQLGLRRLAC